MIRAPLLLTCKVQASVPNAPLSARYPTREPKGPRSPAIQFLLERLEPCPISRHCDGDRIATEPQDSDRTSRDRKVTKWGNMMRIWLEHDPVALAILVFGIAAVELLALSF